MKNIILISLLFISIISKAQQEGFESALKFDIDKNLTITEKAKVNDSITVPLIYTKNLTIKSTDNNQTFSLLNDNSSTRFTSSNKIDFFTNSFELSSITSNVSKFSTYSSTNANSSSIKFFKSQNDNLGTLTRTLSGSYLGVLDFNGVNSSGNEYNAMKIIVGQTGVNGDYGRSYLMIQQSFSTTVPPVDRYCFYSNGFSMGGAGNLDAALVYSISLGANVNQSFGVTRNSGASGKNLLITSGGSATSFSNGNSGFLQLQSGLTTGTGYGQIEFYRNSRQLTTGTSDNVQTPAMMIMSAKPMADNTATNLFSIVNAVGTSSAVAVEYSIKTNAGAGNESHTERGVLTVIVANDGTPQGYVNYSPTYQLKTNAGTYDVTFSATNANPSVISATANSTLDVQSTISYTIINKDEITVNQL